MLGNSGIAKSPVIEIASNDFTTGKIRLMVDTGAQVNLLKKGCLDQNLYANTDVKYDLFGISSTTVKTLGEITVKIGNTNIAFQLVRDDFPIRKNGILGSKFFHDEQGSICYKTNTVSFGQDNIIPFFRNESTILPARSKKLIYVRTTNCDKKQVGYLEQIKTKRGIYIGEALVESRNGIAFLYAFNTTSRDVTIKTPVVTIHPIEDLSVTKENPAQILNIETRNERTEKLLQAINLEHLDETEHHHATRLIRYNADLFHLEGEKLSSTHVIEHTIDLTDDQPIRAKLYRYPPSQRDEIKKQVKELLDQDIIRPSTSQYASPVWIVPKKSPDGAPRWRMVIDYRQLNDKSIACSYPLPSILEILDSLQGAQYFTTVDLSSGFHQIPMA